MTTRTYPTTRPHEAGPDHRVGLSEARHFDFADSFAAFPDMVTKGGFDMSSNPREAEVQAFRPTLSGGSRAQEVVIVLRLAAPTGEASLMLSKAEAQELALVLLKGVYDVGPIEVAVYLEGHPPLPPEPCGEVLFTGNQPYATCTQESGREHSHSDRSAVQVVADGLARVITGDDVLFVAPLGSAGDDTDGIDPRFTAVG